MLFDLDCVIGLVVLTKARFHNVNGCGWRKRKRLEEENGKIVCVSVSVCINLLSGILEMTLILYGGFSYTTIVTIVRFER